MGKKSTSASFFSRRDAVGFFFPCYLETVVLIVISLECFPVKNVKILVKRQKHFFLESFTSIMIKKQVRGAEEG